MEKINMNEVVKIHARVNDSLQNADNEVKKLIKLCRAEEKFHSMEWDKAKADLWAVADNISDHIYNEAVADECNSTIKKATPTDESETDAVDAKPLQPEIGKINLDELMHNVNRVSNLRDEIASIVDSMLLMYYDADKESVKENIADHLNGVYYAVCGIGDKLLALAQKYGEQQGKS